MITKQHVNEIVEKLDLKDIAERANDFHRNYYLIKMAIRNAYNCAKYGYNPFGVPLSYRWLRIQRLTHSGICCNSSKYFGKISAICGQLERYGDFMERCVLFEITNK